MAENIAGLILAGGKSARMGGRKKLFLNYRGKSFYQWIKESLSDVGDIYVSVDECDAYEGLKERLVVDIYRDTGPIGGICTGLKLCREEMLLAVPCDMIPVPEELLQRLIETYERTGRPVCPVMEDKLIPMPAIYSKEMLRTAEKLIREGNYKLYEVWKRTGAAYDTLVWEHPVENVNTQEEYKRLEEI